MDVLSPTSSIVVCIGCLHRRRMILLGAIPHQETLDENVFAAGFLRELWSWFIVAHFSPWPNSAKPVPLHFETSKIRCSSSSCWYTTVVHGKIENCSLCTACLSQDFKNEDNFLLSLYSYIRVVREHSRCFIAYKCGIVLQRTEALQGTASTKADV